MLQLCYLQYVLAIIPLLNFGPLQMLRRLLGHCEMPQQSASCQLGGYNPTSINGWYEVAESVIRLA